MEKVVIYIHGKGGNAAESAHYKPLFDDSDVVGLDYSSQYPWESKSEFPALFESVSRDYKTVDIIANSIGAFLAMNALADKKLEKAYFISPVVDMERLITDMMLRANVSENELREKKEIKTAFGEILSWEYLCYVRDNRLKWNIPTHILYGNRDNLTSFSTISVFSELTGSTLTVMKNGEHWFHTEEQMTFLDNWIRRYKK